MSSVAAKLFFKKAWAWLKNYWYIPALAAYTLVMWIVFRKENANVLRMFEISKENYQKEIETINSAHRLEMEKKTKAIKNYQDALNLLEERYKIDIEKLDKKEKEELLIVIEEHKESPEGLAEEMRKLFGINNE
jgi:hypothetical protein